MLNFWGIKMKRIALMLIFGFAVMSLAGNVAFAGKIHLRLASQYAVQDSTTKLLFEFKDEVEKATDDSVKVTVYPANQLGDYTQVYEELRRGTIDMALITVPSQFDSRLEVTYLHYLAMNYPEARKIYAEGSQMFHLVNKLHADLGVRFLGFNAEGFGGIGLAKMATNIKSPEAPKSILLRVPPMAVFQVTCDDEGFQTVSIPYAELYTALQTGVADGWSGGPARVNYMQFKEVIKHFVVCNNFFETTAYLMSQKTWDKLDVTQKAAVEQAVKRLSAKSFDLSEQDAEDYLGKMQQFGIEVIRFDDQELAAWANRARTVTWKKLEDRLTPGIIQQLLDAYK